mmetsp:Transcript_19916/g.23886  ORF Transcript_19916/g.23886 Transcript_19916/m.23886 type:complete len:239 (-) Transcript_19916:417-1133(-)|eukprot:CAMPEP_0197846632 /NCGR_PEP_ID=MMETSP1438-20131217/3888_1 /TAXON_ID=1461541 /ORGANISM="Pterosperma sp., Strain CCMP1384" /LENGTH=238 /DNA_ID=CAMNT_0043458351 /DNA_START=93 /DNA_END=809 /DNA_ORIENTATION=+
MSDAEKPTEEAAEAPKEAAPAAPAFTFGAAPAAGTGFQFGSFAAPAAPAADAGDDDGPAKEEECQASFKPVIEAQEVETVTGEEDEDILHEVKAKLYRFENDEWRERGLGQCKLLCHKETKKARLLMRRNKTLKICMNQAVQKNVHFEPHAGNDKAWVWTAADFADGELKTETLTIRFGTAEKAQEFKDAYCAEQKKLPDTPSEDAVEVKPKEDTTKDITDSLEAAKVEDDKDPEEEK